VVFAWNLQQRWERGRISLHTMSYLLGDVLVDKQDGDIFALLREVVECLFNRRVFRLRVDD
jgi:hypothetical protein